MRKFRKQIVLDGKTFDPVLHITMTENGVGKLLFSGPLVKTRYTADQQATINDINKVLFEKDMPVMSQEEADFAVGIHSTQKPRPEPTEEEIQRLAGFHVEKKITYTGP